MTMCRPCAPLWPMGSVRPLRWSIPTPGALLVGDDGDSAAHLRPEHFDGALDHGLGGLAEREHAAGPIELSSLQGLADGAPGLDRRQRGRGRLAGHAAEVRADRNATHSPSRA